MRKKAVVVFAEFLANVRLRELKTDIGPTIRLDREILKRWNKPRRPNHH